MSSYNTGPSKYYFNDSAGFEDEYDSRRDPRAGPPRREYRSPHYFDEEEDDEEEDYGEWLHVLLAY